MSVEKRKITKHVIKAVDNRSNDALPAAIIQDCLPAILAKPETGRVINDRRTNRIHYLDTLSFESSSGTGYFVSAKHHHRPPLVNAETLGKRENPKEPQEGEEEKTHFAIGFGVDEAYLLLEQKHGGVTSGKLAKYIDDNLRSLRGVGQHIQLDALVSDDFRTKLRDLPRVISAEIYTDTSVISDTFGEDITIPGDAKEEVELILRSKRGRSIKDITSLLYRLFGQANARRRISRMRILGKTDEKDMMILDTDKLVDSTYIDVELDENHQVKTDSILPKLAAMIQDMLGERR